jgi:hypothetical protein
MAKSSRHLSLCESEHANAGSQWRRQHGFLELGTNDGNTAYNGLEVDIKRQLTHGLAYQVSYTFSHNLADYVDNLTGNAFPAERL